MHDDARRVLLLPGWQNSGPTHWQSRWEALHGYQRVQQADWLWPRRGDWMAQLEDAVLRVDAPVWLAAHSLGCHLVAAWASHTGHADRVRGALLVAPPDLERADMPPQLHNWLPVVHRRLPFPAVAVLSSDDPYCALATGRALAADWGARLAPIIACGHINGDSDLGDWPPGLALLRSIDTPNNPTPLTP